MQVCFASTLVQLESLMVCCTNSIYLTWVNAGAAWKTIGVNAAFHTQAAFGPMSWHSSQLKQAHVFSSNMPMEQQCIALDSPGLVSTELGKIKYACWDHNESRLPGLYIYKMAGEWQDRKKAPARKCCKSLSLACQMLLPHATLGWLVALQHLHGAFETLSTHAIRLCSLQEMLQCLAFWPHAAFQSARHDATTV